MASCWTSRTAFFRIQVAATFATSLAIFPLVTWGALALGSSAQPSTIRIGGSSTVLPIMTEAIRAFRAAGHATKIDLKETGTSDGFRNFCAGKLEVANASRPINSKELKACASNRISFIELPIALDAITVVVNPANSWASQISTKELARLWGRQAKGRINRWSDVNRDWPNRPIRLCGPGKDSGTYDYFNKAINGSPDNSRQDYASSEDDNVFVRCVTQNANALGYFGFSYYKTNQARLKALAILAMSTPVSPSIASVQSGRYRPLSRPLFFYVNDRALARKPELQKFTTYAIRNGLRIVGAAGDVPLPASTYRLVETKLYKRITGSSFSGDLPVDLSIGEALRRSFDANKLPQFR
ncbi:MAG: PstS family phosphate ABC transporter substrate-binding protein [Cyanobacteriota bacterium]|jgi:phosphate transport system substrate-binding protein